MKKSKEKIIKGYLQRCVCSICGYIRIIHRKQLTSKDYSFWCSECYREVAQKGIGKLLK